MERPQEMRPNIIFSRWQKLSFESFAFAGEENN